MVRLKVRVLHFRRSLQATREQLSTLVFSGATEKWAPLAIERNKKWKVIKQDYTKRERTSGPFYKFIRSGVFGETTPSKWVNTRFKILSYWTGRPALPTIEIRACSPKQCLFTNTLFLFDAAGRQNEYWRAGIIIPLAMNSLKSHLAAVIGIFHTFGAKMIGVEEAFYKQESWSQTQQEQGFSVVITS